MAKFKVISNRSAAPVGKLEDDLDALFKLPLTEFTAARNTLAAQLKRSGRRDGADRVKALAKPSISAWAVNQLYWKHREAFDELIASGQRFRQAQASGRAGKVADMREALNERRDALSQLSDLASALLRDAGSNPSPETIHRITTTLEGVSAYPSFPDDARPGRLTRDVDPPGFDSFASLIPSAGGKKTTEEVRSSSKSAPAVSTRRKAEPAGDTRNLKKAHHAKIAAAKVSLQEAKRLLNEERTRLQRLEATQKKANADAKQAERHKRESEERFEQARIAAEAAVRRARDIAAEADDAEKALEEAQRTVEEAAKELERLFQDSPTR